MKTTHGFTLLELLVALSITSIVMCTAIPGMNALLANAALDSESSMVYRIIQSARLFAIERRKSMTVCFINADGECVESAGLSLVLFQDENHDRRYTQDDDVMITQHSVQHPFITTSSNRAYYQFQSDGTTAGIMGTIQICHSDNRTQKSLIVILSGKVRMTTTAC